MNEKRSVCFIYERGFIIRGKCFYCDSKYIVSVSGEGMRQKKLKKARKEAKNKAKSLE